MSILPDLATLAVYLGAAVALILAPGPDTLYVLARGAQSRSRGVRSALGVATGVLLHTLAAALGLAALLRAAPVAYSLVTYLGAAYLVYLGVQTLRGEGAAVDEGTPAAGDAATGDGVAVGDDVAGSDAAAPAPDGGDVPDRSYLRGVAVNVLNPKVALFFLAFLPQFAGSGPDATARMILLGGLYSLLTAVYLSAVALASHRARRLVGGDRAGGVLRWGAGATFVALGASVALGGR
ncbi:LysE family translocator [Halobium salinum]|uniref:LysE family translocator n=1 Tax=Halobium salinum TaxID=1364940 RepID=A0ABD5P926_9EURY|nr:LysE family translocator [Halobium salinum]